MEIPLTSTTVLLSQFKVRLLRMWYCESVCEWCVARGVSAPPAMARTGLRVPVKQRSHLWHHASYY